MTATRTTVETKRVTLYRVRRPDGTLIDTRPAFHPATAVKNAWKDVAKYDRDLLRALGKFKSIDNPAKAAEELGYTIEPIEYAPLPSEETRRQVIEDYKTAIKSACRERVAVPHLVAALAELEQLWGGKA